jgi:PKD repeat protein
MEGASNARQIARERTTRSKKPPTPATRLVLAGEVRRGRLFGRELAFRGQSIYFGVLGRGSAVVVLALFASAAPANAAQPSVTITASATVGAAPLTVTFEARGDAASYRWQLGNGDTAEGPTATAHTAPGCGLRR